MEENELNLCYLLKDHISELFYCSLTGGYVVLKSLNDNKMEVIAQDNNGVFCKNICLNSDGSYLENGEIQIFPSKNQKDWNVWIEDRKPKVAKTWEQYTLKYKNITNAKEYKGIKYKCEEDDHIENSVTAFVKIHVLIKEGYGGNPSYNDFAYSNDKIYIICPFEKSFDIMELADESCFSHIAFHERSQAEEFMSYYDNVQLLKDYFGMK